jgi:hypothetical protein
MARGPAAVRVHHRSLHNSGKQARGNTHECRPQTTDHRPTQPQTTDNSHRPQTGHRPQTTDPHSPHKQHKSPHAHAAPEGPCPCHACCTASLRHPSPVPACKRRIRGPGGDTPGHGGERGREAGGSSSQYDGIGTSPNRPGTRTPGGTCQETVRHPRMRSRLPPAQGKTTEGLKCGN